MKNNPLDEKFERLKNKTKKIRVGYVGAIAEWFDTDLIKIQQKIMTT